MAGLFKHGHIPCDGGFRIDEVGGVEARSACLALVAVGVFVAAVGACAGHVAVGEELLCLFVVKLHRGFLDEFTFIV